MSSTVAPARPASTPVSASNITLAQRLSAGGELSHPEGLRLFKALARELDRYHAQGQVHGHLHPHRVRLDSRGQPSLVPLAPSGTVLGTPHYTSPEQVKGQPATAASDRYAFAVMVYQWLARRRPFEGTKPNEVLQQHLFTQVPLDPLRTVPEKAQQVLMRALSKDPSDRWLSAQAMMEALTEPLMVQLAYALTSVAPTGLGPDDTQTLRWGGRLFAAVVLLGSLAAYVWFNP